MLETLSLIIIGLKYLLFESTSLKFVERVECIIHVLDHKVVLSVCGGLIHDDWWHYVMKRICRVYKGVYLSHVCIPSVGRNVVGLIHCPQFTSIKESVSFRIWKWTGDWDKGCDSSRLDDDTWTRFPVRDGWGSGWKSYTGFFKSTWSVDRKELVSPVDDR